MGCPTCGNDDPGDPSTGYHGADYCSPACEEGDASMIIRIDADTYADHDDCLAAAAADYAAAHDLAGWDLDARWADNQRDTIILTTPCRRRRTRD